MRTGVRRTRGQVKSVATHSQVARREGAHLGHPRGGVVRAGRGLSRALNRPRSHKAPPLARSHVREAGFHVQCVLSAHAASRPSTLDGRRWRDYQEREQGWRGGSGSIQPAAGRDWIRHATSRSSCAGRLQLSALHHTTILPINVGTWMLFAGRSPHLVGRVGCQNTNCFSACRSP